MKSHLFKLCCIILTVAILVNLLPVQVLGAELRESDQAMGQNAGSESDQTQTEAGPAEIVLEDTSKRTQFSKEYILRNGLHMAVVYPEAVHYEENGEWKDIDNSLIAVGNETDGNYTNTAGSWNVIFPQQLSKENQVSIVKGNYTVSFGMAGELREKGFPIVQNELMTASLVEGSPNGQVLITVVDSQTAPAEIQTLDYTEMKATAEHPEVIRDKLKSRLVYSNVYNDTNVIYDINSYQLKESIVIEEYNSTVKGYRYTLSTGGLVAALSDDGSIDLRDPNSGEIIMSMPAPYMIDDNGAISTDVAVTLDGSDGEYTLTYAMPMNWLSDEERAWPVVLDPVVVATSEANNILDQTIMENYALSHTSGALYVGYETSNGKMWTFLQYVDLPELSSGDVVVNASVSLYRYDGTTGATNIEVHKVKDTWTSSGITWANKPEYDSVVEDYAHVDGTGRYYWDVTDIARGWYEDENTGLMFKATDTVESGNTNNWKKFYSIDYSIYATDWWPYLSITYRNNSGLESYWDYTANGAGRAGTGYVNDYTGNLVWVRDDLGFGGNLMPVSISHIYNSDDSGNDNYGIGYGWKTNFNQTVKPVDGNTNASYIWEDGDGTDHYFILDSGTNTYKDEDGLELTLAVTSSGTTITDKYGNTSYFDTAGRLVKQENDQLTQSSINITYTTTNGLLISKITDGVGRAYNFTYNSSNLLGKITYVGKGTVEISSVSYSYSGSLLIGITDKDGKTSTFSYIEGNLLSEVQDVDGYRLAYTYTTGSPKRVASISEYQGNGTDTPGGRLTIAYTHNQTAFTDHNNNVQIMQFNDWGNTIAIQDGEGRAQYANYALNKYNDEADSTKNEKGNQMLRLSNLQNTVTNYFMDSSFEYGAFWSVTDSSINQSFTTECAYLGAKSLKVVKSTAGTAAGVANSPLALVDGDTFTFSAFIKTGNGSTAFLAFEVNGVVAAVSETLPANSDWTRLQVSYTHDDANGATVYPLLLTTTAGTVYMDCAQLEAMPTASRYNIIENGDFWNRNETFTFAWVNDSGTSPGEITLASSKAAPNMDTTAYKVTGDPSSEKSIYQIVNLSGDAGDTYVLAGWAKGNSVPITNSDTNVREFGLKLLFVNLDGSITENLVSFNPDLISDSNWQYAAIPVVAEEAYTSIIVKAVYSYNANTVYFDGIQLFKENFGSSFTYDTNGNVVSVLDLQGQRTLYEYVNNDLTKQIDPNGSVLTYTYDTRHNVLTATTDEGVVYGFEYDTYGNNTAVKVLYNDVPISVTAAYTEDGNRLLSTTDDLGKVTTYNYNENTNVLEWVQYPNDTESSRTTYSYDQMYRIATSSKSVEGLTGGTALTASYTYTNDMLTTIKTGSTTYSFTYGAFAQRSSIQIGSRTLATYSYTNDPNRYLNSIDYGNGDKVQYSYDNQGRVIKETFEDGKSVSYAYDNTGALATVTDSGTGRKTTYHYDLTNRMVKYVETGSNYRHSVGYEYDELNNLTLLVETINGDTHTTSYTYDSDNRITSMATGSISQTIGYDNYGRIATMTMKNGQMSILSTLQTYRSTTTGVPSRQLLTTEITSSTDFLKSTTPHDDNGNIVGIIVTGPGWMDTLIPTSNGTSYIEQISYTYDTANQLVRENNYRTLITSVWEYDNAGNILSRTDYPYTVRPVEFETPIAQDVYHYEDSAWGDLLTGIDNVSFTYDENGNLLNDGYWTYSWEHGRQLSGMTNGTTTWIYTYDAKGMRTSRSNGTDTYTYVYNGNQLSQMTVGNDTLYFTYGVSGPASVTWNDVTYYYALNGQGDVIGIFDASGNCVVTYHWSNAWGWMPYAYGSMASTLGTLNPLRYRGYVYDEETSLYYLNSRYYAPTYGRFISPDVVFDYDAGLQGYNLYAYCGNNPASRVDISGTDSVSVENLDITDDQLSEKEGGGNVYSSPGGSSGSMVGSISYISSKSPASSISPAQVQAVTTGTSNAIGKAGEELAGIDPAAKQSITINGRTRIPDKLTFDALIEVKNVKYISNTLQLRDFAQYATTNHLGLELFVRPTTRIARTIIEAGWNINYLW